MTPKESNVGDIIYPDTVVRSLTGNTHHLVSQGAQGIVYAYLPYKNMYRITYRIPGISKFAIAYQYRNEFEVVTELLDNRD